MFFFFFFVMEAIFMGFEEEGFHEERPCLTSQVKNSASCIFLKCHKNSLFIFRLYVPLSFLSVLLIPFALSLPPQFGVILWCSHKRFPLLCMKNSYVAKDCSDSPDLRVEDFYPAKQLSQFQLPLLSWPDKISPIHSL